MFFFDLDKKAFRPIGKKLFPVLFFLAVFLLNTTVHGADSVPSSGTNSVNLSKSAAEKINGITVGINGIWKNGFWTPITVRVSPDALREGLNELEIIAEDSDGVPTSVRQKWKNDASPDSQTICLPLGRAQGILEFRLYDKENKLIARREMTPEGRKKLYPSKDRPAFFYQTPELTTRPIYLIVGEDNIGLTEAFGELLLKEENRPRLVRIRDFSELPAQWYGLEAVERIILSATDKNCLQGITKNDVRLRAIEQWVHQGGRLLLLAGKDSLPLLQKDGLFAPFVPGPFNKDLQEIRMANALRSYVPKAKNLVMNGSLDAPYLYVPRLSQISPDIMVDVLEGETPLLFRRAVGFGSVTFFGADLSEQPIARWSARSRLVIKIFGYESDKKMDQTSSTRLVQRGYHDLSGQLWSVLDSFQGVSNLPFSLILGLTFLYILVIGPGDWYLTHHLIKKPGITWITFPVYIILFCVLAIFIGKSIRHNDFRVNQAELVDIDAVSGSVRGTTWIGFYSPRDLRLDLHLNTGSFHADSDQAAKESPAASASASDKISFKPEKTLFSWLGLQGDGLGGMSPKTKSLDFWKSPYLIGENSAELRDLPVKVRSSKSLFGRWFGKIESLPQGEIVDKDGMPSGEIVNPFSVPIKNAVLLYGRWAFNMGDLKPGTNKIVTGDSYGSSTDRKSHKTLRKELRHVIGTTENPFSDRTGSATQNGLVRYNAQSADIPYILQTMMFYRLAGGLDTIGLDNSYHQYLDAGDLILDGRALLIGTIDDRNGFPLQTTLTTSDQSGKPQLFGSTEENEQLKNHVLVIRMAFAVKRNPLN